MSSRERLRVTLERRIPDRVPMVDISYWPPTLERWREEGMPEGVEPADYFGLDYIHWFVFDNSLRLPEQILEENERWRIFRNADGVVIREWRPGSGNYSPPTRLDCLVKDWESWLKVKERLGVEPGRIGEPTLQMYEERRRQDRFVVAGPGEPMWFLIEHLTGFQIGLPLLVEQPDLVADILNSYTDFILGMCQLCVDKDITFDALWLASDLCYKNGMLFSPNVYRELLMPCHRRIKAWCDAQNIPLLLHCDGDVRNFIPLLIEAGFDAIQPLEARCGNDVRKLKPLYGADIVLFGNISVDVMSTGSDDELREEVVSKVTTAKEGGGYIYHCDHSIPPTVSLASYTRVIELVREYGTYDA